MKRGCAGLFWEKSKIVTTLGTWHCGSGLYSTLASTLRAGDWIGLIFVIGVVIVLVFVVVDNVYRGSIAGGGRWRMERAFIEAAEHGIPGVKGACRVTVSHVASNTP